MLHFKITIEVVETGATKTIEREGIENTLEAARKFMWESLPRPAEQSTHTGVTCACVIPVAKKVTTSVCICGGKLRTAS